MTNIEAKSNIKILRPIRGLSRNTYPMLGLSDIQSRVATVFLREEKTSKGKKLCIVMRVSQKDWHKAVGKEVVELVWIPSKRLGFTRFQPVLLRKDCSVYEYNIPPMLFFSFIRPRAVVSKEALLTAYHLREVLAGCCYCCGHYVHPKLNNQDAVLEHLEPIVEANRIAAKEFESHA